jgi:tungstate transport system substrate-binding protein
MDSGLLDVLIPRFQDSFGYAVKVVAVGTGEALKMGERGDADVLLVHAPQAEEEFMSKGWGKDRRQVMHNEFWLLGPSNDPAHLSGLTAQEAFKKIGERGINFVSRGDNSGTHKKELEIWQKVGVEPQGEWYIETGQGMGASLKVASEKGAYVLSDNATYLAMKDELNLKAVVRGDKALFNPYHVITVNPDKNRGVNYQGALDFVNFITGEEAQKLISNFGREKFNQPLFIPDALG